MEQLQSQLESVIEYSQELDGIDCGDLLKEWRKAKERFIKAFGGEIYTCSEPVSFTPGEAEIKYKFEEFKTKVRSYWNNLKLYEFLDALSPKEFYNNLLKHNHIGLKGEVIQKGMKTIKAFKYFEEDKTLLTDMQNEASRLIQENKITGTLCFSVHPLDFLSSSENAHNWRSCHALDGDYRAGNLSYMLDSCTFLCYLRADDNAVLPNFPASIPWNSKKWRMLCFLSDDSNMVFAGRQYPFGTANALNVVKKELMELFDLSLGDWTDYQIKSVAPFEDMCSVEIAPHILMGMGLKSLYDIIEEPSEPLFFNDLLHSSCYTPFYCFNCGHWNRNGSGYADEKTKFTIGANVTCPRCHQQNIRRADRMVCNDCVNDTEDDNEEDYYYCECCDRRLYIDDVCWLDDGFSSIPLCESCYTNETTECPTCGRRVWTSELQINRETNKMTCGCCRHEELTRNAQRRIQENITSWIENNGDHWITTANNNSPIFVDLPFEVNTNDVF